MYLVQTSSPALEPLSLADAKLFARVDISHDDNLFTQNIIDARKWIEKYCVISLITQSWKVMFDYKDRFIFNRTLRLPIFPVQSIASIRTYDKTNTATVYGSSNYFLSNGRIALNDDSIWPSNLRYTDCLEINVVAGYGDDAADVPEPIILAMKQLVAFWNEKRLPINDSLSNNSAMVNDEIGFSVKSLLAPYRNFYLC